MSTSQILVVEDERIVATVLKNELTDFGYIVPEIASSAAEAIERTGQEKPDLVLMDIQLQGKKDGIEAAGEIHRRFGTPVVFLSSFTDAETVARAGETGSFGFLVKPYEERELQTTIEMALAKHRAERQLAETESWLAGILEGIDDGVICTDPEMRIRYMNLAGGALFGWRKEEALGVLFGEMCHLVDRGGRIALEALAGRSITESCMIALPVGSHLIAKNGQEIPVEGGVCPIYSPRGMFLGIALTLRNITSRVELERITQQNEEKARQSMKLDAVRRLAGGIAYHLNILMTEILGNSSRALTSYANEPNIKDALNHVSTAGHSATDLIQRLSIFARGDRSQFRPVDLNTLLPVCLEEVKPLLSKQIDVGFFPGSNLWQVNADNLQIGPAFLSLCLNAQDAMPDGGQLVVETENVGILADTLENHPGGRTGDFVRLRISDTGHGMTTEARAKLFEPFFTTKEPGAGLGLASVFAAIDQHHGWMECWSKEGQGARFDLYFPAIGSKRHAEIPKNRITKPRGARPKVLLVDADSTGRDFGRSVLEEEGYVVLLAGDSAQALEAFHQSPERIDLAIIDMNIPHLAGHVVFERLRELDPEVGVLFSSSYFTEDWSDAGINILGFITKPYLRHELVPMVRQALAKQWDSKSSEETKVPPK